MNREKAHQYLKKALWQLELEPEGIAGERLTCSIARELIRLGDAAEVERLANQIKNQEVGREFHDEILKAKSEIMPLIEYEKLLDPSDQAGWIYLLNRLIKEGRERKAIQIYEQKNFWGKDYHPLWESFRRYASVEKTVWFLLNYPITDCNTIKSFVVNTIIEKKKDAALAVEILKEKNLLDDVSRYMLILHFIYNGLTAQAEELLPDIAEAEYYNLGLVDIARSRILESREDRLDEYRKKIKKNSRAALNNLKLIEAERLTMLHRDEEAFLIAKSALKLDKLLWVYKIQKNWDKAEEILNCIDAGNKNMHIWNFASDLAEDGRIDDAVRIANSNPNKTKKNEAFSDIVRTLAAKGDTGRGEAIFLTYLKSKNHRFIGAVSLGMAFADKGEFDKVEWILSKTAKGWERAAAYHSVAQHLMGIDPWEAWDDQIL